MRVFLLGAAVAVVNKVKTTLTSSSRLSSHAVVAKMARSPSDEGGICHDHAFFASAIILWSSMTATFSISKDKDCHGHSRTAVETMSPVDQVASELPSVLSDRLDLPYLSVFGRSYNALVDVFVCPRKTAN